MSIDHHSRASATDPDGNGQDERHPASMDSGDDPDGHAEDALSDASSDVTELEDNEFPSWFTERHGRLFHSHGGSPYPLPVDTPEQERLTDQHATFLAILGSYFKGPVREVLAPDPNRRKRVLDLCTGTGRWPVDMARQFPHVKFTGVDIVPISTRSPPRNVNFEMHDVTQAFRWSEDTMDFIHARDIQLAVPRYEAMLTEVARILRPNGLFLSGEIGRYIASNNPHAYPGVWSFFDVVNDILGNLGLRQITGRIPEYLRRSGLFTDVTETQHIIPIGDRDPNPRMRPIGVRYMRAMERFAHSVKPMLIDAGINGQQLDGLIANYLHDLRHAQGLVGIYHVVWARKA